MLESISLQNHSLAPALFLAPLAGFSHAPFRRLVADFGGYGALYTEMLSGTALLREVLEKNPHTRRRPEEGLVIYQLMLSGDEPIEAIVEKLCSLSPFGLDLNLGCPAPELRRRRAGVFLFRDLARVGDVLKRIRSRWSGPLTVKCRLGDSPETWRRDLKKRLELFEAHGVDALTVHPRFHNEKLRRTARWETFDWIAGQTRIPLIANGDFISRAQVEGAGHLLGRVQGLMLGRIALICPWIFASWRCPEMPIDHARTWGTFYEYVLEDFPQELALQPLKTFSAYFARNFMFGHRFHTLTRSSHDLEEIRDRALEFLEASPALLRNPLTQKP